MAKEMVESLQSMKSELEQKDEEILKLRITLKEKKTRIKELEDEMIHLAKKYNWH